MAISVPTDIAGCIVWLDGDDAGSFSLDGTEVLQWNDKSGNANHFPQHTDPGPTRTAAGLNGKAVVSAAGAERLGAVFTLAQPLTMVFVAQFNVNGSYNGLMGTGANLTMFRRDNNSLALEAGGSPIESSTTISTPYIITAICNGASSFLRYNGSQVATGDIGTAGFAGDPIKYLSQVSGNDMTGFIAEHVVYDSALSGGNLTDVEAYLVAKWFTAGGGTVGRRRIRPRPLRNVGHPAYLS